MKNNACVIARSVLMLVLIFSFNPSTVHAQGFDGLKVFFCGTGGPLASSGRNQPCTAVQAGNTLYLVDNGVGGWDTLRGMRAPATSLKAILITHLHSDHIAGVGEAAEQSWINGRDTPLTIIGPEGVDSMADGFNLVYERDRVFRKAHHEHEGSDVKFPLDAAHIRSRVVAIPDPDGTAPALEDGELTITAIRVNHEPIDPAFAYRFDYKSRSVVISGDTTYWTPLGDASEGADVLIHEAQSNTMQMAASQRASRLNPRASALLADTVTYHTEPREAADLARAAGVQMLVLSHLTQAGYPGFPEAFVEGIEDGGQINWLLAEDGMIIELPADGTELNVLR